MPKNPTRQMVEYRYYVVPQDVPVLALLGDGWLRPFGELGLSSLHLHNLAMSTVPPSHLALTLTLRFTVFMQMWFQHRASTFLNPHSAFVPCGWMLKVAFGSTTAP